MTTLHRQSLPQPGVRRGRSKLADRRQVEQIRALCLQARIEPPRVVWRGEAQAVIRRLEEHLRHKRQPSLFGEQVR